MTTWLSTWPSAKGPAYREHPTEAAAEAHALEVVRSGRAEVATCYESPVLSDERNPK